ncbi:hypothetical protein [Lichenihabitans psoromatis]|uniref:hypothetical protein n=1 Tax=Lichenihabitans psoromatis TaxID=2528642 RepID=UPI00103842F9|nr:hypothetical protein [Lichenihabitans psoromatis]
MSVKVNFSGDYQTFRGIIVEMRIEGIWEHKAKDIQHPTTFNAFFDTSVTYREAKGLVIFSGDVEDQLCGEFQRCFYNRRHRLTLAVLGQ